MGMPQVPTRSTSLPLASASPLTLVCLATQALERTAFCPHSSRHFANSARCRQFSLTAVGVFRAAPRGMRRALLFGMSAREISHRLLDGLLLLLALAPVVFVLTPPGARTDGAQARTRLRIAGPLG
jgi:hypothetical protein